MLRALYSPCRINQVVRARCGDIPGGHHREETAAIKRNPQTAMAPTVLLKMRRSHPPVTTAASSTHSQQGHDAAAHRQVRAANKGPRSQNPSTK